MLTLILKNLLYIVLFIIGIFIIHIVFYMFKRFVIKLIYIINYLNTYKHIKFINIEENENSGTFVYKKKEFKFDYNHKYVYQIYGDNHRDTLNFIFYDYELDIIHYKYKRSLDNKFWN